MTIRSVNVTRLKIAGLTFMHTIKSSFLIVLNSEDFVILNSTFLRSGDSAIKCEHSTLTVINSSLQGNRGLYGAAIYIIKSTITIIGSTFTENEAVYGSAIDAYDGSIIILKGMMKNTFYLNSDRAIGCSGCTIKAEGVSIFEKNTYIVQDISQGGAISLIHGASLTISGTAYFLHNRAVDGGAISVFKSNISFDGSNYVTFEGNSAEHGGAIHLESSEMFGNYERGRFIRNTAKLSGGAIYVGKCLKNSDKKDLIDFYGKTWLDSNAASIGGAIKAECAIVRFIGNSLFKGNSADSNGGALYALSSDILFHAVSTELRNNSALYGGAMYIDSSRFTINSISSKIKTYYNSAKQYGGVIYHKDAPTFSQCINLKNELPYCFLQLDNYNSIFNRRILINSYLDTAGNSGNFLYGGLLDRCKLNTEVFSYITPYNFFFKLIEVWSEQHEHTTTL